MPMKDGKPIPYGEGGGNVVEVVRNPPVTEEEMRGHIMDWHKVGRNTVADLVGDDLKKVYDAALRQANEGGQKGRNMGGVVKDELGYMNGGMSYTERGPIRYSKGGAVKGKTFRGSY